MNEEETLAAKLAQAEEHLKEMEQMFVSTQNLVIMAKEDRDEVARRYDNWKVHNQ